MKHLILLLATLLSPFHGMAQVLDTLRHEVVLETSMGNVRIVLHNETPLHRDNFLKLVREGYYDGNLFHRVISSFMIQTGDSTSRHAQPGAPAGDYSPDYTLPAEIRYPALYHHRGAVAAARESDDVNPEHRSSASQFYIVYGRRFNEDMLDQVQARLDKATKGKVTIPPALREAYYKKGGTPHLDGQYTVFGEVVEGMDVVQAIQNVETDAHDRPLQDVRILRAVVVK
ncbi:peptidylprolyl isomerase [Segatella baroniae]|uniref:peptidylprolyl isomerase n=1 Tax=Segatella baroniae F0067 TaxID=1115809 RepID=U2P219_9BACT|nr:peptidyl-prolyl cis-trans isomerase, cyclophilin-type [Segatella baroniae F0067]